MTDYRGRSPIRGIRNNNPGNIDLRPEDKWLGMAGLEQPPAKGRARFIEFEDSRFGIRASARLIRNYEKKYGLNTVAGIIGRWAPPNENRTDLYIEHVCNGIQAGPDDVLNLDDRNLLRDLLRAIFVKENGSCPYSDEEILEGVDMALEGA